MAKYCILHPQGGTSAYDKAYIIGAGSFYYQLSAKSTYSKDVPIPTRTCFYFDGWFTAASGGVFLGQSAYLIPKDAISPYDGMPVYAQWTRRTWAITLNRGSGSGGTSTVYGCVSGGIAANDLGSSIIGSVTPPTRSGYIFLGYTTQSGGQGETVIDRDGVIDDSWASQNFASAATLYARWINPRSIAVDANGGSGGLEYFYFWVEQRRLFTDAQARNEIETVPLPSKPDAVCIGLYSAVDETGERLVDAAGAPVEGWEPTDNATITVYARWREVFDVELDPTEGGGGTARLYYDSGDGEMHDASTAAVVSVVDVPRGECLRFLGYYSAVAGGTELIDEDGAILAALYDAAAQGSLTIYAQWEKKSWYCDLYANDGSSGKVGAFYGATQSAAVFYADDDCTIRILRVAVPTYGGHVFLGYFTNVDGGDMWVDPDGTICAPALEEDAALFAHWSVKTYRLTYNYNGATGGIGPTYKDVTWGQAIGAMPAPTRRERTGFFWESIPFEGWFLGGRKITAATVWNQDGDGTAIAQWVGGFSSVKDWFGLGSDKLIPVASSSGEEKPHVCVAHMGRYSPDVAADGGVWRNPSVTYMIVKDCKVRFTLGAAFAGESGVSGYMITSGEIATVVGEFPRLVVSGTANEGRPAINLWNIEVNVLARARAQNLGTGLSLAAGDNLMRCAYRAVCDPVVVAEGMMPCASDVVRGRVELSAEVWRPAGQAAPGCASGFTLRGCPMARNAQQYTSFEITAGKELA